LRSYAWLLGIPLVLCVGCAEPQRWKDVTLPSGQRVRIWNMIGVPASKYCQEFEAARKAAPPLPTPPVASTDPVINPRPVCTVPPHFPPDAEAKRVEGWVDMEFTVTADGTVADPRVVHEEPAGFGFGDAALNVIPNWTFPPKVVDGAPVPFPAKFRLSFKLK